MAAARNGSARCSAPSPSQAFWDNASRALSTFWPAETSWLPNSAAGGTHRATTPAPYAMSPRSVSDSTAASATRTATMNSATGFKAAHAAASATSCTSEPAAWMRYTWAAENSSDKVTSSATAMPAVVEPFSSRNIDLPFMAPFTCLSIDARAIQ